MSKKGSDVYVKEVLSSDTRPDGAFSGQQIIETDTGFTYEWTGLNGFWKQVI